MAADTFFFTHVEKPGYRHPYDALPGDWMYPANRWKKGQIIEHRILVQIPPNMRAGDYDVYMGVYRRSTGERRKVIKGTADGGSRLKLGMVQVRAMLPYLDHLIPKTDITVQRKYPDRIVSSKRQATPSP